MVQRLPEETKSLLTINIVLPLDEPHLILSSIFECWFTQSRAVSEPTAIGELLSEPQEQVYAVANIVG